MNIPRRLRTIAKSQLKAIQERLDKIDTDTEPDALDNAAERAAQHAAESSARDELNDPTDRRLLRRTPEEIAAAKPIAPTPPRTSVTVAEPPAEAHSGDSVSTPGTMPLATAYRIFGLEEGADWQTVQAEYRTRVTRNDPAQYEQEPEKRAAALEMMNIINRAYDALRDALDPTAGRFDKLEL